MEGLSAGYREAIGLVDVVASAVMIVTLSTYAYVRYIRLTPYLVDAKMRH